MDRFTSLIMNAMRRIITPNATVTHLFTHEVTNYLLIHNTHTEEAYDAKSRLSFLVERETFRMMVNIYIIIHIVSSIYFNWNFEISKYFLKNISTKFCDRGQGPGAELDNSVCSGG